MVEESHAYIFCSLSELSSNHAVKLCGRGIPTDMVVDGDNVSCIVEYPETHDISWVSSALRNLATANSDSPEHFMLRIEEQCPELLHIQVFQLWYHVIANSKCILQDRLLFGSRLSETLPKLTGSDYRDGSVLTDAMVAYQFLYSLLRQSVKVVTGCT